VIAAHGTLNNRKSAATRSEALPCSCQRASRSGLRGSSLLENIELCAEKGYQTCHTTTRLKTESLVSAQRRSLLGCERKCPNNVHASLPRGYLHCGLLGAFAREGVLRPKGTTKRISTAVCGKPSK
jgi:hypothetical protein